MLTVVSFCSVRMGFPVIAGRNVVYTNPLVILSALSMLLYFNGLRIKSSFINWCAASSFAIFLLHTNPNLCEQYFITSVEWLYNEYNGIGCFLIILAFLLAIGIVAILIDQIRKALWKLIEKKFF